MDKDEVISQLIKALEASNKVSRTMTDAVVVESEKVRQLTKENAELKEDMKQLMLNYLKVQQTAYELQDAFDTHL